MVQEGVLREGDVVVCGGGFGRVKGMYDTLRPRQRVKEAGPSMPVNVPGLDVAPNAGDKLYVLEDIAGTRALADERQVEIRRYEIIYKLTDDIKLMIEGKLKPEERVVDMGAALVKQVFTISRVGSVAGCQVIRGTIERACRIRVNRDNRTIG